jgi:hypothetical protein
MRPLRLGNSVDVLGVKGRKAHIVLNQSVRRPKAESRDEKNVSKFGADAIRVRTDPCLSKTQRAPLERSLKTLFFVFGKPTCKQPNLLEREAKRAWVLSDYCEESPPAITLPFHSQPLICRAGHSLATFVLELRACLPQREGDALFPNFLNSTLALTFAARLFCADVYRFNH